VSRGRPGAVGITANAQFYQVDQGQSVPHIMGVLAAAQERVTLSYPSSLARPSLFFSLRTIFSFSLSFRFRGEGSVEGGVGGGGGRGVWGGARGGGGRGGGVGGWFVFFFGGLNFFVFVCVLSFFFLPPRHGQHETPADLGQYLPAKGGCGSRGVRNNCHRSAE